jgi:hypothetical protein
LEKTEGQGEGGAQGIADPNNKQKHNLIPKNCCPFCNELLITQLYACKPHCKLGFFYLVIKLWQVEVSKDENRHFAKIDKRKEMFTVGLHVLFQAFLFVSCVDAR